MKKFFIKDRIIGMGSVLLGILLCFLSRSIPESTVRGDIGSKAFPVFAAALLIICGGLLLLQKSGEKKERYLLLYQWKRLLTMYFSYVFFAVALWLCGFVISTPVFLFWLTCLLGKAAEKKPDFVKNAIFSILLTALIFYLYQQVLHISLPKGIIFG